MAESICMSSFLSVDNKDIVCPGIVPFMAAPVLDMITRELLTELRICNMLLGFCALPVVETLFIEDYNKRLLSTKPEEI